MLVRFGLAIMDVGEHTGQWQCASKRMELGSFGTMLPHFSFGELLLVPTIPHSNSNITTTTNEQNVKAGVQSDTLEDPTKIENLCQ